MGKRREPIKGYSGSYLPLPYSRLVVQLPPVALQSAVTEVEGFLVLWTP